MCVCVCCNKIKKARRGKEMGESVKENVGSCGEMAI